MTRNELIKLTKPKGKPLFGLPLGDLISVWLHVYISQEINYFFNLTPYPSASYLNLHRRENYFSIWGMLMQHSHGFHMTGKGTKISEWDFILSACSGQKNKKQKNKKLGLEHLAGWARCLGQWHTEIQRLSRFKPPE